MPKAHYVNCPFCRGLMEIDAGNGEILQKWAPDEKPSEAEGDKMSAAIKKLEDAKRKRADLFNVKQGELKNQKKKIEDAFRQEVERVKKEGVQENPIRPFDLD